MRWADRLDDGARVYAVQMELNVHKVPMLDTGLGREAGYRDDADLIQAAKAQRAEIERLLTPEALAALDAAEDEATRRILFGA